MISDRLRNIGRMTAILATSAFLVAVWLSWTTDYPGVGSGAQYLRYAQNLANFGVFSEKTNPTRTPAPSMFREPLPAAVVAGWMLLAEPSVGDWKQKLQELNHSPRIRVIKFVKLLWGALATFAIFVAVVRFTGSYLAACLAAVLVTWMLGPRRFDGLETELEAAALLALSSLLLAIAVDTRRPLYFGLGGLSFGALALTKAVFLFVVIVLAVLIGAWGAYLLVRKAEMPRRVLTCFALFPLTFAVTVVPWMVRNYVHFDSFNITERGGFVLYRRVSIGQQMTGTEYLGAFYAWAPMYSGAKKDDFNFSRVPIDVQPIIGPLLGFTPADLEIGGRLERLDRNSPKAKQNGHKAVKEARPEDALTFFWAGSALRAKVTREMAEQGHPFPRLAADRVLRERAMQTMLEHPWRHLATTLPFLWRGAAYTFPVLLAFAIVSLLWRRLDMLAYVLPALGAVLFYALFTHDLPRYNFPMNPFAAACLVILVWMAAYRLVPAPSQHRAQAAKPQALL